MLRLSALLFALDTSSTEVEGRPVINLLGIVKALDGDPEDVATVVVFVEVTGEVTDAGRLFDTVLRVNYPDGSASVRGPVTAIVPASKAGEEPAVGHTVIVEIPMATPGAVRFEVEVDGHTLGWRVLPLHHLERDDPEPAS